MSDTSQAPRTYSCSLVVPTKNGGELWKRVVAELQRQTCWKEVEFVIVDSGSDDDTVETARAAGAKCFVIPPKEFNHGATRDFAVTQTTTGRIVMSVQDATPYDTHMIESLIAALNEDGVGGVYARQIPQPDADVLVARNLNSHFTSRLEREVRSLKDTKTFEAMTPVEKYTLCNFDNVCSAMRKSVWEKEKFGRINFGEDIDWAERVLKRGYKIVYEPAAAVVHSHDRPLSYEYKRTYVCHVKLYQQYRLELTPTLWKAIQSFLAWTFDDMFYVAREEKRWRHKIAMLIRTPALNYLRAKATYQAIRDEKAGAVKAVQGV